MVHAQVHTFVGASMHACTHICAERGILTLSTGISTVFPLVLSWSAKGLFKPGGLAWGETQPRKAVGEDDLLKLSLVPLQLLQERCPDSISCGVRTLDLLPRSEISSRINPRATAVQVLGHRRRRGKALF